MDHTPAALADFESFIELSPYRTAEFLGYSGQIWGQYKAGKPIPKRVFYMIEAHMMLPTCKLDKLKKERISPDMRCRKNK